MNKYEPTPAGVAISENKKGETNMETNIKQLLPARSVHPGEVLRDELEAREIKQRDFSSLIGLQPTQLNEIIKGKRNINADSALLIGKALSMDPKFWINLQTNYDLDEAERANRNQERLKAIDLWSIIKQYVPINFFKKEGVISGNPIKDIPEIKKIYKVQTIDDIAASFSQPAFARLRKSDKLTVDKIGLLAWIRLVVFKAECIQKIETFKPQTEQEITARLKEIVFHNKNTVIQSQETLLEYGIKLIIQKHPEKCAVDGIAFWSGNNPAIGLTLRYNRIDHFAFTLFHELGHVFQHLKINHESQFIDIGVDFEEHKSKEEDEANKFAKDNLIDCSAWESFFEKKNKKDTSSIIAFANKQKVHPAIVKGRLSHELKNYKLRIEVDSAIR